MKYFSLKELMIAVPASLIFGVLFALFHTVITAVMRGTVDIFDFSKPKPKIISKFQFFSKTETKKSKVSDRLYFILSEIVNCIVIIIFSILFTVFIYIVSDGIIRGYIIALVLAAFVSVSKICKKPLNLICELLSKFIRFVLLLFICLLTYFPIKLHKKTLKRKKYNQKCEKKRILKEKI